MKMSLSRKRKNHYRIFMRNCYIIRDWLVDHSKATNKQIQALILSKTGQNYSIRHIQRYIKFMRSSKNYLLFYFVSRKKKPAHHKHSWFATREIIVPENYTSEWKNKQRKALKGLTKEQRRAYFLSERRALDESVKLTKDKYIAENNRRLDEFISETRLKYIDPVSKKQSIRFQCVERISWNPTTRSEELEFVPKTFGHKIEYCAHVKKHNGQTMVLKQFWNAQKETIDYRIDEDELYLPPEWRVKRIEYRPLQKKAIIRSFLARYDNLVISLPDNVVNKILKEINQDEATAGMLQTKPKQLKSQSRYDFPANEPWNTDLDPLKVTQQEWDLAEAFKVVNLPNYQAREQFPPTPLLVALRERLSEVDSHMSRLKNPIKKFAEQRRSFIQFIYGDLRLTSPKWASFTEQNRAMEIDMNQCLDLSSFLFFELECSYERGVDYLADPYSVVSRYIHPSDEKDGIPLVNGILNYKSNLPENYLMDLSRAYVGLYNEWKQLKTKINEEERVSAENYRKSYSY